MNHLKLLIIKLNISIKKTLLNNLLIFFSYKNKLIISLSQNLDKSIAIYQNKLFSQYYLDHIDI